MRLKDLFLNSYATIKIGDINIQVTNEEVYCTCKGQNFYPLDYPVLARHLLELMIVERQEFMGAEARRTEKAEADKKSLSVVLDNAVSDSMKELS